MSAAAIQSRRWVKRGAAIGLAALLGIAVIFGLWRHSFPYGSRHCCNKALSMMLGRYASEHGGRYPDAGGSAASLALLANGNTPWDLIVGKGGLAEAAEKHFRIHGTLPDEFSTWHYVPGLREDSEPGLALFWDTTGLSHAGMRQSPVRYEVCFVDGSCRLIDESEWSRFLKQQEELMAEERERQTEGN